MKFDSVVFADSASLAALSCLSRLRAERDAGRKSLLICVLDTEGAEAISALGLGEVARFEDLEKGSESAADPWRERLAVVVRRLRPQHIMAPLGLLGAPQALDYFKALRAVSSADPGRDVLFFEERPHGLMPGSVALRLASLGARLPPASGLRSSRRYTPFALRLLTGVDIPPVFGNLRERVRLAGSLKPLFRDAALWDPQRALGPRLQPVVEPWTDRDTADLFVLAAGLGQELRLGSKDSLRHRMARAAGSGESVPVERYWLLLPDPLEADPMADPY